MSRIEEVAILEGPVVLMHLGNTLQFSYTKITKLIIFTLICMTPVSFY